MRKIFINENFFFYKINFIFLFINQSLLIFLLMRIYRIQIYSRILESYTISQHSTTLQYEKSEFLLLLFVFSRIAYTDIVYTACQLNAYDASVVI